MSKKKYFDAKRALVFMLGALVIEQRARSLSMTTIRCTSTILLLIELQPIGAEKLENSVHASTNRRLLFASINIPHRAGAT
jgi:hypothetical protein